jgi:hypothetical protein
LITVAHYQLDKECDSHPTRCSEEKAGAGTVTRANLLLGGPLL